jgi:hypothetical protein
VDPDPGSGIRNRFFPDPESLTHIFESLVTIFGVETTTILSKLLKFFSSPVQKLNKLKFFDICGYKKESTNYFSPPSFSLQFLDPGSGMDKSGSGV